MLFCLFVALLLCLCLALLEGVGGVWGRLGQSGRVAGTGEPGSGKGRHANTDDVEPRAYRYAGRCHGLGLI